MENLDHDEFLEEYRRAVELLEKSINSRIKKVLEEAGRRMTIGASNFKPSKKKNPGQLGKGLTKEQLVNKWYNKK